MPYTPNIDGTMVRLLGEWGAFFKANGEAVNIIELMDTANSILDDILWREASEKDGHHTAVRTGLPQVFWRRLYKGIDISKSSVAVIKDPVAMLESRAVIDAKLLAIYEGQARAYRMAEAKSFMEAMRQELATAIFYGSIKDRPDVIHGLDPRYAFKDAPQVVDAGGTSSEACTSAWGVIWGDNDVCGLFPKGSKAGLEHKDLGEHDAFDVDGKPFRAVSDLYSWNVGLAVPDWRAVVRICNIPVDKLMLKKGDAGFIDLHRLTIIAKNKIPAEKRNRMKWYVNQDVMTALELQASDAGNVTLIYRKEDSRLGGPLFKSYSVADLHGCPVRQCDAILSTEEALSSKPV